MSDNAKDLDLELLKARKMMELRRRLANAKKPTTRLPPREIVVGNLVDRGLEVLEAAESQYPSQMPKVVEKLAELISKKRLKESITGGDLISIFRYLGMNVRVETRILVGKEGKLKSFEEALKEREED